MLRRPIDLCRIGENLEIRVNLSLRFGWKRRPVTVSPAKKYRQLSWGTPDGVRHRRHCPIFNLKVYRNCDWIVNTALWCCPRNARLKFGRVFLIFNYLKLIQGTFTLLVLPLTISVVASTSRTTEKCAFQRSENISPAPLFRLLIKKHLPASPMAACCKALKPPNKAKRRIGVEVGVEKEINSKPLAIMKMRKRLHIILANVYILAQLASPLQDIYPLSLYIIFNKFHCLWHGHCVRNFPVDLYDSLLSAITYKIYFH